MKHNNIHIKEKIKECLELQERYSAILRTVVSSERLKILKQSKDPEVSFSDPLINESLLEHIGHLPFLATFWHPICTHSENIDLGRVLQMLAIHDIGETKNGDINSYLKTAADTEFENNFALTILPETMHKLYNEFEADETLEAKFARTIDGFAVEFKLLSIPMVAIVRAKEIGFTIGDVVNKKRHRMEWDPVLLSVFDLLMEHYQRAYNNEELLF